MTSRQTQDNLRHDAHPRAPDNWDRCQSSADLEDNTVPVIAMSQDGLGLPGLSSNHDAFRLITRMRLRGRALGFQQAHAHRETKNPNATQLDCTST